MDPIEQYERASALKHDLGKYVAWMSANFPDDAWLEPLEDDFVAALQRDILETRKRAGEPETAWDVWARLTDGLTRPFDEDELNRVDHAVAELRAAERALRDDDRSALAQRCPRLRTAQREIRAQLRTYHRRLARALE
ncbi:MAG: hypothetical protein ACPG77_12095 [Nannocystaceae bacterium]